MKHPYLETVIVMGYGTWGTHMQIDAITCECLVQVDVIRALRGPRSALECMVVFAHNMSETV